MTGESVLQQVLERAFSDSQFRSRLETGFDEVLEREGYILDQEELQRLKAVLDEGKDTFATGLDQRLSQSGVSLSPQALLRAKSKVAAKTESIEEKVYRPETRAGGKKARPATQTHLSAGRSKIIEKEEIFDDDEPDYEIESD